MNTKLDKLTALILIIAGALSFFALGLCCGVQHTAETLPSQIAACDGSYIVYTDAARVECID